MLLATQSTTPQAPSEPSVDGYPGSTVKRTCFENLGLAESTPAASAAVRGKRDQIAGRGKVASDLDSTGGYAASGTDRQQPASGSSKRSVQARSPGAVVC